MKRQDLKVGVEYAVTAKPVRGRRRSWNKPHVFKATLVELSGRVERTVKVYATRERGKQDRNDTVEATAWESGIVVRLDKPVMHSGYEVYDYVMHDGTPRAPYYGDERKTVKFEVTEVALENAGCFVSTWADYQASLIRQAQAEQAETRRKQEELERAVAEEPEVRARLNATVEKLTELGFDVELEEHYGSSRGAGPDYEIKLGNVQVGEIPVQLHHGHYSRALPNPLTGFRLELNNDETVAKVLGLLSRVVIAGAGS